MNLELDAGSVPEPPLSSRGTELDVVAGIDIGGTSTHIVLRNGGALVAEASASTPAQRGGQAMIDQAVALVREQCSANGLVLRAAGVGAAGVVDSSTRRVVAASATFADWAGFDVGAALDRALGVPNSLDNDVNAFLLGELTAGALHGLRNVAGITLGTGVGGAVYLDGALWHGPSGAAGELGHTPGFTIDGQGEEPCTCGQRGHLESIASGRSITRRYLQRRGPDAAADAGIETTEVARRARERGDASAQAVFFEAGLMVGRAAVMIAAILDITDLVVGGGVARSWDLLRPGIDAFLLQSPPVSGRTTTIVPSTLEDRAVATGAAVRATSLVLERWPDS